MKVYLKIKIKSLALEAAAIRDEEKRFAKTYRYKIDSGRDGGGVLATRIALHEHRVNHVRKEARASLLAYGFLNGHEYSDIEAYSHTGFSWKRVEELVKKYGEDTDVRVRLQRFAEWKDAALQHIEFNELSRSTPVVEGLDSATS
jgi:hypothetical protein